MSTSKGSTTEGSTSEHSIASGSKNKGTVSKGSASEFESRLLDYLLFGNPSTLVIVGHLPGLERLSAASESDQSTQDGPQLVHVDSLSECVNAPVPTPQPAYLSQSADGTDDAEAEAEDAPENAAGTGTAASCVALVQFSRDDAALLGHKLESTLGQAVRRFPEKLVVSIDAAEPEDTAFFAFGFRKLQLEGQGPIRLFEYCLSEYKQPPAWLNARYWANPDRFSLEEESDIYSEDGDDDDEEEE